MPGRSHSNRIHRLERNGVVPPQRRDNVDFEAWTFAVKNQIDTSKFSYADAAALTSQASLWYLAWVILFGVRFETSSDGLTAGGYYYNGKFYLMD